MRGWWHLTRQSGRFFLPDRYHPSVTISKARHTRGWLNGAHYRLAIIPLIIITIDDYSQKEIPWIYDFIRPGTKLTNSCSYLIIVYIFGSSYMYWIRLYLIDQSRCF